MWLCDALPRVRGAIKMRLRQSMLPRRIGSKSVGMYVTVIRKESVLLAVTAQILSLQNLNSAAGIKDATSSIFCQ